MGLSRGDLNLLIKLINKHSLSGDIMTLGKVDLFVNKYDVNRLFKENGWPPTCPTILNDVSLFQAMGFKTVTSLDYTTFEGADLEQDLNCQLKNDLLNVSDVILDHGTIEHIFDVKQVLRNIYDLLRIGGTIVHIAPSNNLVDHGFYQFSPTFFRDYYSTNSWEILECNLIQQSPRHNARRKLYEVDWQVLEKRSHGGWNSSIMNTVFIARKNSDSTWEKIPQQNFYATKVWKEKVPSDTYAPLIPWRENIKSIPFLGSLLRQINDFLLNMRRKKKLPKLKFICYL